MERIQTGSEYRETVDIVDTDGEWIQANSRYSGCRLTVDTEDTSGQWIQRIQADRRTSIFIYKIEIYMQVELFSFHKN